MIEAEYKTNFMRLAIAFLGYLLCLYACVQFLNIKAPADDSIWLFIPLIVSLTFAFQLMDTVAGMGLGTALAPLLFVLGYEPLTIVPTLLISQAFTGILAGWINSELGNVNFAPNSPNSIWRALLLVTVTGSVAVVITIVAIYDSFETPDKIIKTYVAAVVMLMGVLAFLKNYYQKKRCYKNSRLLGFALLAAFNKGIGGGGYGPVLTLGALLSGYKEKETVALTVTGEGLVSLVGAITFFVLISQGLDIDYSLLPSVLTGGFLASFLAPYFVKICPSNVLRMIIPSYAILIGIFILADLYIF